MKQNHSFELAVVFSGNIIEAGFIRNLLEANGIQAFMKDEFVGTIAPWVASTAGMGSVKVEVLKKDLSAALQLIKESSATNKDE